MRHRPAGLPTGVKCCRCWHRVERADALPFTRYKTGATATYICRPCIFGLMEISELGPAAPAGLTPVKRTRTHPVKV